MFGTMLKIQLGHLRTMSQCLCFNPDPVSDSAHLHTVFERQQMLASILGSLPPRWDSNTGYKKKGKKRLKNKDYTRCKLGFNAFHTGVFLNITPNCEARALRG